MKRSSYAWLVYGLCLLVILPAMIWLSLEILSVERMRDVNFRETELARQSAELQERISSALWRMDGMLLPLVMQEAGRPYDAYEQTTDLPPVWSGLQDATFQDANNAPPDPPDETRPASTGSDSPGNAPMAQQRQARDDAQVAFSEARQQTNAAPNRSFDSSFAGASSRDTNRVLLLHPSRQIRLHFEIDADGKVNSPEVPPIEFWPTAHAMGCPRTLLEDKSQQLDQLRTSISFASLWALCPPLESSRDGMPAEATVVVTETPQSGGKSSRPVGSNPPPSSRTDFPDSARSAKSGYANYSQQQIARNAMRGSVEFEQRLQTLKAQRLEYQLPNRMQTPSGVLPRESVMKAVWQEDRLLLARRAVRGERQVVQGCWLNWQVLHAELTRAVADLLPEAELVPVYQRQDVHPQLALAALPVELSVDRERLKKSLQFRHDPEGRAPPSGLKLGLVIAWAGLGALTIASAVLLAGVLQLNERRSAFVSAVTHELRTPLTTFRMYAEMLAEGMVPTVAKQRDYARTLKIEADRLAHLVENVLQFARLERGRPQHDRKERITVGALLDRFTHRLCERANQDNMQMEYALPEELHDKLLETTPSAVEQVLFNLVDNACKYARDATDRRIVVYGQCHNGRVRIGVRDFGPGIGKSQQRDLFKAFRKSDQDAADTAQGVGLGLALCQRMARSLGGALQMEEQSPGVAFFLTIPAARREATG